MNGNSSVIATRLRVRYQQSNLLKNKTQICYWLLTQLTRLTYTSMQINIHAHLWINAFQSHCITRTSHVFEAYILWRPILANAALVTGAGKETSADPLPGDAARAEARVEGTAFIIGLDAPAGNTTRPPPAGTLTWHSGCGFCLCKSNHLVYPGEESSRDSRFTFEVLATFPLPHISARHWMSCGIQSIHTVKDVRLKLTWIFIVTFASDGTTTPEKQERNVSLYPTDSLVHCV